MNAINFIQQHGVENAREVVEGAPEWSTHFDGYLYSEKQFHEQCFLLSDLKRLVESLELVKSCGGIINAKYDVKYLDLDWDYDTPRVTRLKQAIADYESVYSIPESVRQAILNLEMHL